MTGLKVLQTLLYLPALYKSLPSSYKKECYEREREKRGMTKQSKKTSGDIAKGGAVLGTLVLTSILSQLSHQYSYTHFSLHMHYAFLKTLKQKFECMTHSTLMYVIIQNTHCGFATSSI